MKRLSTYLSLFTLLLSVSASSVLAASGGGSGSSSSSSSSTPPPLVINCAQFDSCTVYVNDVQFSNEDGTKSEPFRTITAAANFVKNNQDYNSIRIAAGTYNGGGITISNQTRGFYVQGGYSEDFSVIDPENNQTIADASGSYFMNISGTKGHVKGLTIKNADKSALSVSINGSNGYNFDVKDNIFTENFASGSGISAVSMVIQGTNTGTFENNLVQNNNSPLDEVATFNGGTDNLTIKNNVFLSNGSEEVFFCEDATAYNNYFIGNTPEKYVVSAEYNCKLYNNTIDTNSAGLAIINSIGDGNDIANNLVTNSTGLTLTTDEDPGSQFRLNAFHNNALDPDPLGNNYLCNPQYAVPGGDPADLTLAEGSSCLDKGGHFQVVTEDFFGTSRPQEGDGFNSSPVPDPGAFELPEVSITAPVISDVSVTDSTFSPNDDNYKELSEINFTISEKAEWRLLFEYNNQKQLISEGIIEASGSIATSWNGTYFDGNDNLPVDDGSYTITIAVDNSAGLDTEMVELTVDRSLAKPTITTIESNEQNEQTETETETESESKTSSSPIDEGKSPEEIAEIENAQATLAVNASAEAKCAAYSDVLETHAKCQAIVFVKSKGAMTGNPDGTFAPGQGLQRDQIAKIVLEAFELFDENEDYCKGSNPFPDVTSNDWSYQYICRAVELGLVTGYKSGPDAGKYVPAKVVNRAEALALLLRYLSGLPSEESASFEDVQPGQWFSGYAKFAKDNELFLGAKLHAVGTTSRLEVADILFKLNAIGKLEAQQ